MTHFRFRYKRVGYMRWRCRSASRRVALLAFPVAAVVPVAPATASWRRSVPKLVQVAEPQSILKIGDFVVGEEGDPKLIGHPDIRY